MWTKSAPTFAFAITTQLATPMSDSTPSLGHRPDYPDVRERIFNLYSAIASLDCLDPSPATNAAFTNFINL